MIRRATRLLALAALLAAGWRTVAYSHYWPAWGGVNGSPTGRVASGAPWQEWADRGAACPPDWPFGTLIMFEGDIYTCVDRGSAVTYTRAGLPIIDFLHRDARHGHKTPVEVYVWSPEAAGVEMPERAY
jgi:hypothetical protein